MNAWEALFILTVLIAALWLMLYLEASRQALTSKDWRQTLFAQDSEHLKKLLRGYRLATWLTINLYWSLIVGFTLRLARKVTSLVNKILL